MKRCECESTETLYCLYRSDHKWDGLFYYILLVCNYIFIICNFLKYLYVYNNCKLLYKQQLNFYYYYSTNVPWSSRGFFDLCFSYYEVLISPKLFTSEHLRGVPFLKQVGNANEILHYSVAAVICPDEFDSNNRKQYQFKEGVSFIPTLNKTLKTIGVYYIYSRAVIVQKVLCLYVVLLLGMYFSFSVTFDSEARVDLGIFWNRIFLARFS